MRNRKAFFSVAIAAAVLLAGTAAMGGGPNRKMLRSALIPPPSQTPPSLMQCTPPDTNFTFKVSSGPSFVPCENDPSGVCTRIEYQVSGEPEVVYALEGKGVVGVSDGSDQAPCVGIDSFGLGSCHEQAIEAFPDASGKFSITLKGVRRPGPTSVAVPGRLLQACEILGIGLENSANPDQITQKTETLNFKGCAVTFVRDTQTGDVLSAALDPEQSTKPLCTDPGQKNCCKPLFPDTDGKTLVPQPVTTLKLNVKDGDPLGSGKFGEGYISTGGDSCTTRVIGGKVYTWGTPCP